MRHIITFLLFASLGACTSSSPVAQQSSPTARQFESRLASQAEVDRAIAIVRAYEALRGKRHHIEAVANEPDEVSYWIAGDELSLLWRNSWAYWTKGSCLVEDTWVGNTNQYCVNLKTGAIRVGPGYWLHDVEIKLEIYHPVMIHSMFAERRDWPDRTPRSMLALDPISLAKTEVEGVERAIAVVRAKETLAGDDRLIKIVGDEPDSAYSLIPGEAVITWLEPTDHHNPWRSGALGYMSNEHVYTVTLATNEVRYRIDWFSYPPPFWR